MKIRETEYGTEIGTRYLDDILTLITNDRIRNKIIWREEHIIPIRPPVKYIAQRSHAGMVMGVWRIQPNVRPFPLYQSSLDRARKLVDAL